MQTQRFSFKENILALVVSFILVMIGFFLMNNNGNFFANVLDPGKQNIEGGDIVFETKNKTLIVRTNKTIDNPVSLQGFVIFSEQKSMILFDTLRSTFDVTSTQQGEGMRVVFLSNLPERLSKNTVLFEVKLEGDPSTVTLSDLSVTFSDNSSDSLSITKQDFN